MSLALWLTFVAFWGLCGGFLHFDRLLHLVDETVFVMFVRREGGGWGALNAADVGVCSLNYSAIRKGRVVVLPTYLDDGDDLAVTR